MGGAYINLDRKNGGSFAILKEKIKIKNCRNPIKAKGDITNGLILLCKR